MIGMAEMKKLFFGLVLLILTLPAGAQPVCKVPDGKTLILCNGQKVRLACVDAPEMAQAYGAKSRDALRKLADRQDAEVNCVDKAGKNDICFVRINGQDVNWTMVSSGYAFAYA